MLHGNLTLTAVLGDEHRSVPTAFLYANFSRQFEYRPFFTFIPHPVLTPLTHHIIY